MSDAYRGLINEQYGRVDLYDRILGALSEEGKDLKYLSLQDLAAYDQFHMGGRPATEELARMASLQEDMRVLDIGGGIGGPARWLAQQFGCRVTVLDITEEFCRTGERLTKLLGLQDRISFRCASALDLPFGDSEFDTVWTQHSTMNIPDKVRLYAEARRVLVPGGVLAMHEVLGGSGQSPLFPLPWAATPSASFLEPASVIRDLIMKTGFEEIAWVDFGPRALQYHREQATRLAQDPGLRQANMVHLLHGPEEAKARSAAMIRNLEEGRITVYEGVFRKHNNA